MALREWAWVTEPTDDLAIAELIMSRLRLDVESTEYGTPVCRAAIIPQNGIWTYTQWPTRLPLTLSLAYMLSRMMGASSGLWNSNLHVGRSPNNVVMDFEDITTAPATQEGQLAWWQAGMSYVLPKTRASWFFPAIQSVYPDQTSVLGAFVNVLACCYLEKAADTSWRMLSGVSNLTPGELVAESDKVLLQLASKRFGAGFTFVPETKLTQLDLDRGWSWSCNLKLGANTQRVQGTYTIQAFRTTQLAPK